MSSSARIAAAVFGAVALYASRAAADPDSSVRTRVTIRGTGSNVAIERTQTPARKRVEELPAGVLGEAIRMKRESADDLTVRVSPQARRGPPAGHRVP